MCLGGAPSEWKWSPSGEIKNKRRKLKCLKVVLELKMIVRAAVARWMSPSSRGKSSKAQIIQQSFYLRVFKQNPITLRFTDREHAGLSPPSPILVLLSLGRDSRCCSELSITGSIQNPGWGWLVELPRNAVSTRKVNSNKMLLLKACWGCLPNAIVAEQCDLGEASGDSQRLQLIKQHESPIILF